MADSLWLLFLLQFVISIRAKENDSCFAGFDFSRKQQNRIPNKNREEPFAGLLGYVIAFAKYI